MATTKKVQRTKTHAEKLVESVIAHASTLKKITEDSIKKELAESFSPHIKKAVSQHLSEMEDFEMDDDFLDEAEEVEEDEFITEDEDVSDEEVEVEVEEDFEEAPVEDVAEDFEDVEELEEGDDYGDTDDFMAELKSLLEEDEVEVDEEEVMEEGEEVEEEEEVLEETHTETLDDAGRDGLKENKDGATYTGKESDKNHGYESGNEGKSNHGYDVKAENRMLRESLSKLSKEFQTLALDVKRAEAFQNITSKFPRINESTKLSVVKTLDNAKDVKQVKTLSETIIKSFETAFGKPKAKPVVKSGVKTVKESFRPSRAGKASALKTVKKSNQIRESRMVVAPSLANDWARIAGIDSSED
jgi:hypothetical protein